MATRAAGRPVPDPAISLGDVAVLLVLLPVAAAFEEGGWTGYALDPLRDRWGMARAALTLGFVWAAFPFVADLQGGHDLGWIVLHRTSAGALRVLLVVAYFGTGRGTLAAVLMHAMDNLSWQLFPVGGSAYDPLFVRHSPSPQRSWPSQCAPGSCPVGARVRCGLGDTRGRAVVVTAGMHARGFHPSTSQPTLSSPAMSGWTSQRK